MNEKTIDKLNKMNKVITEYKRGLITYDEFVTKIAFLISACNPNSVMYTWDLTDVEI